MKLSHQDSRTLPEQWAWSPGRDSNPGPAAYKAAALPAELPGPGGYLNARAYTPFAVRV